MGNSDYLVAGSHVYIKGNEKEGLVACDYQEGKTICYLHILSICEAQITAQVKAVEKADLWLPEVLLLFSELLYFRGKKEKRVVIHRKAMNDTAMSDEPYVREVDDFVQERAKKKDSIEELYAFPHMVPWNLVPREYDVIDLVEKYVVKNSKILEIGSGYGKNMLLLKEKGYDDCYGIEMSKEAVKTAVKFKEICDRCTCGNIENTVFENNCFDAVLDIGCLHCMSGDARKNAIAEVYRILRPKGMVISRCFQEKDENWLRLYPIKVSDFGISSNSYMDLFACGFETIHTEQIEEMFYYVGRKK